MHPNGVDKTHGMTVNTGKSLRLYGAVLAITLMAVLCRGGDDGNEQNQKQLTAEAQQIAAEQLKKFGKGYAASYDSPRRLLYISALDKTHLDETTVSLAVFTDAFRKTLPINPPTWNITIILPTVDDYKKLTSSETIKGFYSPSSRTLIAIDRGRVLIHEFTHALHHGDMAAAKQQHPTWICEGFATLFESPLLTTAGLTAQPDGRLLVFQKAIRKKNTIAISELVKYEPKTFQDNAELCYAEARYLMLYLQDQGVLSKWYEAYKKGYDKDPSGLKAMEKVLGRKVFQIEEDWLKWAAELKLPWGELQSAQARLGLQVHADSDGVKVIGLIAGSAAQKAGRIQIGDIITAFNGHKVSNPAEFVGAVRTAKANQTVKVVLKRSGREMTVLQPLGAAD